MKQYHVKNMKQTFIVESLPRTGFQLSLKATEEECTDIAAQLAVEKVNSFTAKLIITQWRRGGVHIEGEYTTTLTQNCVVSLEAFETTFSETIDQKFFSSTKVPELNDKNEGEVIDNDLDPPDALVDGELDISDYLIETLLLKLDPYPRKPGGKLESLAIDGKFEINQPTGEDDVEATDEAGAKDKPKTKNKAMHKPFANLAQLLKDK